MIARQGIAAFALLVLVLPVVAGLAGTTLPAFGYLPALGGDRLSLAPLRLLSEQPGIAMSWAISLICGLATTLVSLVMVMLLTAGFSETRVFSRIQHVISPLLAVPHAAAAFGLAFLVAPSGVLVRLASPDITGFTRPPDWLVPQDPFGLTMMAGLIIKEMPFLFLVTLAALPQLPVRQARQLMTGLGYGRITGFLVSLWPLVYRQIRLPVFAVIAYSTSVVDVAVILGPVLPAPLPVRVTEWMADSDLQMRFLASAGALLQLCATAAAMALWLVLEAAGGALLRRTTRSGVRFLDDGAVRALTCGLVAFAAALVFLGIAALALWSVAGLWPFPGLLPQTFSLKVWMRTLPQVAAPLTTTLLLGAAAASAALVIAIGLLWQETLHGAENRHLRNVLYLPLIVPQLSFVFGLQILSLAAGFRASLPLLLFVHLLFVLPYVMLSLSEPWAAFDRRHEIIAAGLQKSPLQTLLFVRLPMLTRACLTALAIGFAVSVGLYLPTLLIGAGRVTTITTEALALSSGGDRRVIGVYALLQTVLPFAGFLIASLVPNLLFRHRRAMRI